MPSVTIYQMNGRKDTIRLRQGSISHADAERISDGHMKYSKSKRRNITCKSAKLTWVDEAPRWCTLAGPNAKIVPYTHKHTRLFSMCHELVFFPKTGEETEGRIYRDTPCGAQYVKGAGRTLPDLTTHAEWFMLPRVTSLADDLDCNIEWIDTNCDERGIRHEEMTTANVKQFECWIAGKVWSITKQAPAY